MIEPNKEIFDHMMTQVGVLPSYDGGDTGN